MTLVVTNVLLEDNYYARRLSGSLVVFSFAQIFDFLREAHIRLENVILKTLYEYSLIYNDLYTSKIWHSETAGCLFDIDGYLQDVRITFAKPNICDVCKGYLLQNGIAKEKIKCANEELEKLKISWICRLFEWIELYHYWLVFLIISYTIAISIFSSFVYEQLIKNI